MYGNTQQVAQQLRQFQGGRLIVETRNNQDWPPRATNASGTCSIQSQTEACYLAGIKFPPSLKNTFNIDHNFR